MLGRVEVIGAVQARKASAAPWFRVSGTRVTVTGAAAAPTTFCGDFTESIHFFPLVVCTVRELTVGKFGEVIEVRGR